MKELIRKTRELTDKPFGVGVLLPFPHKENIKAILEEKVAVLQVFWGDCSREFVLEAHNAGVKVVPQVGSVEEVKKVIDAGVDAIILQGYEAGGHVIGQDGLISLLPRVVDVIGDRDIPVIAAGGIVDARGYVAALALGAKGICMGTRFVATQESNAHPAYKQKLIEYDQTKYTDLFGRAVWPAWLLLSNGSSHNIHVHETSLREVVHQRAYEASSMPMASSNIFPSSALSLMLSNGMPVPLLAQHSNGSHDFSISSFVCLNLSL
ncbi:hypothetical protein V6N12_036319 [Hibiscus sabdariffa]|uniref:Nitronate monooxygenase domain-containing protein n=1 Tax=Hibiscus sabdariffa TaxID=183260 RepID=A0ABR2EQA4_9ROSI